MKSKNTLIPFFSVFFMLLLFFQNCSEIKGEFGWATTSDEGKDILEKVNFKVTEFKMMRSNLIFSPNDTIHYVYKIQWNLFHGFKHREEFTVSLEKESLGFLEVEAKKKYLDAEDYTIRDTFNGLEIGRYILKIAYEGDVIDSVVFDVLPEEGYAVPEDRLDEEPDDILRYSR
jgi:hypothetical protein